MGKVDLRGYKELFRSVRWTEPEDHIAKRVHEFKEWLHSLPQTHIAVVSHSSFLRHLLEAKETMPNCHMQEIYL